jgi:pimeloyl-ACP methyl ester carboxylesterase
MSSEQDTNEVFPPAAKAEWESYISELKAEKGVLESGLQEECKPKRMSPGPGIKPKGIVLLFHGYTACPQQFFEWAELLNKEGYEVLLPLNPGHGRRSFNLKRMLDKNGNVDKSKARFDKQLNQIVPEDNYEDLPLATESIKYAHFAERLNKVMEKTQGERIVGGLSLGGPLATYAVLMAPKLYKRHIVFAPFYSYVNELVYPVTQVAKFVRYNMPFQITPITDTLLRQNVGWGDGCYIERNPPSATVMLPSGKRMGGRAGICSFLTTHYIGMMRFGEMVKNKAASFPIESQFVGVEKDCCVSVKAIEEVVTSAKLVGTKASVCLYGPDEKENPANHSLFSRYDAFEENKFWLPSLLHDATKFVVDGTAFPQGNPSATSSTILRCIVHQNR